MSAPRFRASLRELMLGMGLGLAALALGSLVSAWLLGAFAPGGVAPWLAAGISQLWVLVVLPALCLAARRLTPPPPRRTALLATATGASFLLLFDWALGLEALWSEPLWGGARLASLLLGGLASTRALPPSARV